MSDITFRWDIMWAERVPMKQRWLWAWRVARRGTGSLLFGGHELLPQAKRLLAERDDSTK